MLSPSHREARAGLGPRAASWVGVTKRYPQHRARSGKVDSIEDRVNCFERSLNGKALDVESREMKHLVAYMDYLSRGAPSDGKVPDTGIPLVQLTRAPNVTHAPFELVFGLDELHRLDDDGFKTSPRDGRARVFRNAIAGGIWRLTDTARLMANWEMRSIATPSPQTPADARAVAASIADVFTAQLSVTF